MFKTLINLRALTISLTILSLPVIASAQASRTWVSGVGDDVNACSRPAPCRTFADAITKTIAGGEINALDAGGYGMVAISKSITIDGSGSMSSTLAGAGMHGILINITATSDSAKTVRLRGLSINGVGTGMDGIRIMAASQVFVEDVVIDGVNRHGINVAAPGAYISVKGTTIRNAVKSGIHLEPTGNAATAMLAMESSNLSTCEAGLFAGRGTSVTARDSGFLHNQTGVAAEGSDVALVNCIVAHGDRGLIARTNSAIRLSRTTVTRNQTGLGNASGGKIISFKNNVVHGNGTDGAPTHTFPEI